MIKKYKKCLQKNECHIEHLDICCFDCNRKNKCFFACPAKIPCSDEHALKNMLELKYENI